MFAKRHRAVPIALCVLAAIILPCSAFADTNALFRAFLPGYLSSGSLTTSAELPETCTEWLEIPEDTQLGEFSMNIRSNMAFEAGLDFPAMNVGGSCKPAILVNIGGNQYSFPINITIWIKDQKFGTIGTEPDASSESLVEQFSFTPFSCSTEVSGDFMGKTALEQILPKTFAGSVKFDLRSALTEDDCSANNPPPLCECTAGGNGAGDQLASARIPLLTVAIAETEESRSAMSRQGEAALLEEKCLAEIDELRLEGTEIIPQNVSEECWRIPQLSDREDFQAGRATSSSIRAQ